MLTTPVPSLHRFDAYRLALEFRRHVVRWLPLRRAELSDQLDRASISVPLTPHEVRRARVDDAGGGIEAAGNSLT